MLECKHRQLPFYEAPHHLCPLNPNSVMNAGRRFAALC